MARPRFDNLDPENRRHILETAAVEFAARGFEGASLNQLIDRLGMSKGSFYYYFDNKADLFTTVAHHAWTIVLPVEDLDLGTLDEATFWPALHTLVRSSRARVHANPWVVGFTRLMYNPPADGEVSESLERQFNEARQWQGLVIRRGQEVGAVRNDLPADLLLALLVGADEAGDHWFVERWENIESDEIERLFEEVFGIYRRMLEDPRETS